MAGLIAAGIVGVAWFWFTGAEPVVTPAAWLTEVGRLTGLLAGYLAAVLLGLMARIPALEHSVGSDRLARWHALGGRYTVTLVVVHAIAIVWGYALGGGASFWAQGARVVLTYPDLPEATVAGLLLVGVGITSARAARRRLKYETWHFLHLYTYLAIALGFAHQLSAGAHFVDRPVARAVWTALYVGVGLALVRYRLLEPLRLAFRHQLRVADVVRESGDVVSLHLTGVHLDELAAQPGQFFRWRILARGLWYTANPYSLSAPVQPDLLRITVRAAGDHSGRLAAVRPGTWVFPEGPYGAFTADRRRSRRVLLIGGGVGITPLRSLFETLPAAPGDVTLLYRASRDGDVLFRDEFAALTARTGHRVHYLVGRRADLGHDPLAADRLTRLVPDVADRDIYVCGPDGMVEAARRGLAGAGVPDDRIHVESFAL